ncbi:MAG: hypothetical protein HYS86_05605 [Candidatus Chisholmbacteria bacterium]|nr:hypothetical protein [Candidatus Chisholmbacteria bacterium]
MVKKTPLLQLHDVSKIYFMGGDDPKTKKVEKSRQVVALNQASSKIALQAQANPPSCTSWGF